MRTYMKREEVVTKSIHTGTFCDKCENEIPTLSSFEVNEFVLERMVGYVWPEGNGSGEKWKIEDLCNNCIDDLRVLLQTWGVTIKESEWEAG